MDERAEVVVIGGGVVGLSAAFHLAEAGVDVLLLERDELGAGSTCRAAGGVRAQFSDPVNIALGQRGLAAFERFGQRPGGEIDLRQNGYLFLLDDPEHVTAFERNVVLQNEMGVPSRMLTVAEARELSPLVAAEGLLAAAYSPTDGHCTPEAVVQGYARGARAHGARIRQRRAATGIEVQDGRITAVRTDQGRVMTSVVVCASGAWSAAVGEMVGIDLPVVPLRRQIVVTEPIADLPPGLPMTIDFGTTFYFHEEGRGLLVGMSDPEQEPGFLLSPDEAWLPRLAEAIARRAPALSEVGIAHRWAGLYEMSPDHNAMIGEAAGVSRFLYATGFSGHGFLQGPAVGEVLRDLVLGHRPVVDVSAMSAQRFAASTQRPELNCV
ncbi:NAD(P)/FAD-dependent oxidoreductase [Kutzneria albida]|uniref:Sarcosine oxidase subunit beta n=1 Tax=Kutzneria albida DSM 43870 TaxID=1449976 RepID=W5VYD8_9PSEU|nr:FAD-binding oxidoreductase [Kutzneria albida]AHH93582.1 sarcosine oxidase subunit beta [Kutzneria albida DSM 43870]